MSDLDRDEIMNSFTAVKFFLQNKKLNPTQRNEVVCSIKIGSQPEFDDNIEFECIDFEASYILHSDTFKAYGYSRPVWSKYHLFTFDEDKCELRVNLNNHNFIIK